VAENDRLGGLKVREPRGRAFQMGGRLADQGVDQRQKLDRDGLGLLPQIQLEVVCGLVVARATRAQLAAQVPEALDQMALDEGMNIFVAGDRCDLSVCGFRGNRVEGSQNSPAFVIIEDASTHQFKGMSARPGNVEANEAEVACIGAGVAGQRRVGLGPETTTPKGLALVHDFSPH